MQDLGQCSALVAFEQGYLCRDTPVVKRYILFSGFIKGTAPFCRQQEKNIEDLFHRCRTEGLGEDFSPSPHVVFPDVDALGFSPLGLFPIRFRRLEAKWTRKFYFEVHVSWPYYIGLFRSMVRSPLLYWYVSGSISFIATIRIYKLFTFYMPQPKISKLPNSKAILIT
jgi:hypothetical protein